MTKFLFPVFGLMVAASFFFVEPSFAQMIDINDNPSEIQGATNSETSARAMALRFINFFLYFLGLIATGFVIYGGFLYITSGGDDQGVEKAKKILTFAAIGIVVVLISFALINTLLGSGLGNRALT